MKRLFSTPKRAAISVICAVVVIVVICVMAARSTLITRAEAAAVALGDAGLGEEEASALRTRFEFDDGRFQYEVDFYNNGITYEYLIQAKDGDIIARDIEGNHTPDAGEQPDADKNSSAQPQREIREQSAADGDGSVQPQEETGDQSDADGNSSTQIREEAGDQSAAGGERTTQSQGISPDEAKAAALKDAGLSEADVTFKKTELDHDKGMQVYDIEFYTSDTEYDYEINASDGAVLEKSVKSFQGQPNSADSGVNSSGNNYIGVDRAKEIALNHANLNETDVVFAKAKLENDDGRVEYEIEFYFGRTEYEYTIDAVSGNIIEYDADYD